MINRLSFFILLVALTQFVHAQGTSTGASQLKIPLDARSAALGESNVADEGQLSAWLVNPANLFSHGNLTISLTHNQWIQESQSEYLAVQIPATFGTIGMGVSTNTVPGIEIRDIPGPSLGTFSARFAVFQMGLALQPFPAVTVGASGKFVYQKLYADDGTGFGFDFGAHYQTPLPGLRIAASITNTGTLQPLRTERSDLPAYFRGGLAYSFGIDDFVFIVNGCSANNLEQSEHHAIGSIEATYKHSVSMRLGYASGYESRGLTAGLGVQYEFLQFSYAYVPFSLGLGDAHLFSLAFAL
ncbi:MAG TPA: PorV/PorQ family protein [Bacteroidota bacterium]|nr:PorV/PorQ family protein [Bacteroidota bacterium]